MSLSGDWLAAWQVSDDQFPSSGSWHEQARFFLKFAILAPSSHNSQPWRFRIEETHIDVLADRSRRLPIVDPEDRELTMSCGAALQNILLAMRRFGIAPEVKLFPRTTDPDFLARIGPGGEHKTTTTDHSLFDAILKRHTNRKPFGPETLPEPLLQSLRRAADQEDDDTWLHVVVGADTRNLVADLVAEGDLSQAENSKFRKELASWVRSALSGARDGLPGYAIGRGGLAATMSPFFVRWLDWGQGQADRDVRLLEGSPSLAVLMTRKDSPLAWLRAGQALSRVLLTLRAAGGWASFLNQPIEVPRLREQLREAIAEQGRPQLLMRLGFGPNARPTPRRDLSDVLID